MTPLQIINDRVKALQKKHPRSKRTTLQKQAGKEYRDGKLSKHSKIKTVKRTASKSRRSTVRVTVNASTNAMGSVSASQLKTELRRRLVDKLDKLVLKKYHATTKRDKTKIQKEISAVIKDLKKLN